MRCAICHKQISFSDKLLCGNCRKKYEKDYKRYEDKIVYCNNCGSFHLRNSIADVECNVCNKYSSNYDLEEQEKRIAEINNTKNTQLDEINNQISYKDQFIEKMRNSNSVKKWSLIAFVPCIVVIILILLVFGSYSVGVGIFCGVLASVVYLTIIAFVIVGETNDKKGKINQLLEQRNSLIAQRDEIQENVKKQEDKIESISSDLEGIIKLIDNEKIIELITNYINHNCADDFNLYNYISENFKYVPEFERNEFCNRIKNDINLAEEYGKHRGQTIINELLFKSVNIIRIWVKYRAALNSEDVDRWITAGKKHDISFVESQLASIKRYYTIDINEINWNKIANDYNNYNKQIQNYMYEIQDTLENDSNDISNRFNDIYSWYEDYIELITKSLEMYVYSTNLQNYGKIHYSFKKEYLIDYIKNNPFYDTSSAVVYIGELLRVFEKAVLSKEQINDIDEIINYIYCITSETSYLTFKNGLNKTYIRYNVLEDALAYNKNEQIKAETEQIKQKHMQFMAEMNERLRQQQQEQYERKERDEMKAMLKKLTHQETAAELQLRMRREESARQEVRRDLKRRGMLP
jgi:hypothetical protein